MTIDDNQECLQGDEEPINKNAESFNLMASCRDVVKQDCYVTGLLEGDILSVIFEKELEGMCSFYLIVGSSGREKILPQENWVPG